MEFKKNIRNLSKDIEDIGNFVRKIENNSHISRLEMDILKTKIHKLYQTYLNFDPQDNTLENYMIEEEETPIIESKKSKSDDFIPEEKVINDQKPVEEDEVPETLDIEDDQFVDDSNFVQSIDHTESESFGSEEMIDEEFVDNSDKESNEEATAPSVDEPVHIKKAKDPEVIADIYKNKKKFRNESIQTNNIHDISSKFHSQPISDISLAIGLNDKFRYIRELFDGNNVQYAETLRFLNNVKSENEAVDYLNDKFEWDMETKLVKSLLELTARKLKMTDNG